MCAGLARTVARWLAHPRPARRWVQQRTVVRSQLPVFTPTLNDRGMFTWCPGHQCYGAGALHGTHTGHQCYGAGALHSAHPRHQCYAAGDLHATHPGHQDCAGSTDHHDGVGVACCHFRHEPVLHHTCDDTMYVRVPEHDEQTGIAGTLPYVWPAMTVCAGRVSTEHTALAPSKMGVYWSCWYWGCIHHAGRQARCTVSTDVVHQWQ